MGLFKEPVSKNCGYIPLKPFSYAKFLYNFILIKYILIFSFLFFIYWVQRECVVYWFLLVYKSINILTGRLLLSEFLVLFTFASMESRRISQRHVVLCLKRNRVQNFNNDMFLQTCKSSLVGTTHLTPYFPV